MRVHGKIKIKRRTPAAKKTNYHDYLDELKKDFGYICGYCGKPEEVAKNRFEIDHFIPTSFAPELKNDYKNLIYCCFMCNRKKSKKWPTQDKYAPNDGKVGFVDPASDEYDLHLYRTEDGDIQGITDVGKYMCRQIFRFNIRPMREIWKCYELLEAQKKLEVSKPLGTKEYIEYIELNKDLKNLMQYIFNLKE